MAPVRGFTATLRASAPRRAEDATARVAALRFLGDDEGADAAWEDSAGLDFWDRAPQDQCDLFQALRLPGTEPPDDATAWLPRRWVKEEDRIILSEKIVGPAATQERLAAHRDGLDAHTDYLVRTCEIADEDSRFFALSVLKHRALRGDAAARQAVVALLVGLGGPDGERTDLLRWLEEHGLHTPGDPVPLRAGASVRQIRLLNIRLSTEPRPSPLPKADQALLVRMLEAMRRGASAQAHALGLQLRDRHPDEPLVLVNLAAAKELMGEPLADRERLYREALALNPDYLFARCGLARCLAAEGRTDEARALIDGLMEREEMHVSEYRSLMLAQQAIALALGDTMGVRATEKGLRELERHLG
jgi:hypothetical protein